MLQWRFQCFAFGDCQADARLLTAKFRTFCANSNEIRKSEAHQRRNKRKNGSLMWPKPLRDHCAPLFGASASTPTSWPHDVGVNADAPFALHIRALSAILGSPPSKAAMAINGHRNRSFGPGGGTRRLHPSPRLNAAGSGGGEIGSTGDQKGALLLGMIPPLSGQTYSCQRQLCSGGPRRVMR